MLSFVIDLQQSSDGAFLARYSSFRAFSSVTMVQEIKIMEAKLKIFAFL